MSETIRFKVFCLEQYKNEHNLNGRETIALFNRYGVLDYINSFFDVLHSYGSQYIVQDIDMFIEARRDSHIQ